MRPCFTFTAKAGDKPAILALDQEIGFWGTQARDFRQALDAVEGENLVVEINSPGGEVMAGLGMFNMLRARAANGMNITTRVTGVAASIASVIALAGDKREMPKNAFAMIHGVSGVAWGTEDEIRDYADAVAKMNGSLRNIYVDRMGVSEEKAAELMAKDNWLTADEALELGFATDITDDITATASFDMDRADLPANVQAVFKAKAEQTPVVVPEPEVPDADDASITAPETPVAEQIVAAAKAAGFEAHAAFFAVSFDNLEAVKPRLAAAREITALCAVAGKPEMAHKAIRSNKPVAELRAELVNALAEDDPDVDNTQPPPKVVVPKADEFSPTALWATHMNRQKGS